MYWSEPTTWKRVKDNAREIARDYRWRHICIFSGFLTLAMCLGVRYLLPESADLLTVPRIIGIIAVVMIFPLVLFIGALNTGSVIFRKKYIDVSDFFIRCFIPYEQIVRLGFERFEGKSYFYVRGVPLRRKKEVEVHVALSEKYTESDIEAYIVQKGLGHVLAVTHEVNHLPIRTKAPTIPHEPQLVVVILFHFIPFLVMALRLRVTLNPNHWVSCAIALAWLANLCVGEWLLGKGAERKIGKLGEKISMRRIVALGVPLMLMLVSNPAIVFAELRYAALSPAAVWTVSSIWQLAWMALVYRLGRLFR